MTISVDAQVEQLASRSQAILAESLREELLRAIVYCRMGRRQDSAFDMLHYLMVAEKTSAKFKKLDLQRQLFGSEYILGLIGRLEEELGGTADSSIRDVNAPLGQAVL